MVKWGDLACCFAMKITRRHVGIFGLGVIVTGIPLTILGAFFYGVEKHERWVDGRLHHFANYSYDEWLELYDACAQLVGEESGDARVSYGRKSENWQDLPEPVRRTDPMGVAVSGEGVRLIFSGGHSRSLYIWYEPKMEPPELQLYAEGLGRGCVVPREDQRPLAGGEVELRE